MENVKLKISNQYVGIRNIHEGVYEPKNFQVLKKTVDLHTKIRFPVTVITYFQNNEDTIHEDLNKIESSMTGEDWNLIVIDNGSTDDTYEKIKTYNTGAAVFFYRKIQRVDSYDNLYNICMKYARPFISDKPYINFIDNSRVKLKSQKLKSFCFVATSPLVKEAVILIYSIRCFYNEPIYIVCDNKTKELLSQYFDCHNIFFDCTANSEDLHAVREQNKDRFSQLSNGVHNLECIYKKMQAIDFAHSACSNTLFLDCDVVITNKIDEQLDKELIMSPHYWGSWKKFGIFNAGYIFCSSKKFSDFWRESYLTSSTFCEQQGLDEVCEKFNNGIFDETHNCGHWRSDYNFKTRYRSFHTHLFTCNEQTKQLKQKARDHRCFVLRYLKRSSKPEHVSIYRTIRHLKGTDTPVRLNYINGKYPADEWSAGTMPTPIKSNPNGKIQLTNQTIISSHRSGWTYATNSLNSLHNEKGALFDGFLEKNFSWHYDENITKKIHIPYKTPWVGFFHNPQNVPVWFFGQHAIQTILATQAFQESMEQCVGLFALSEYHAQYLREATGKPVSTLYHPTELSVKQFDFSSFIDNNNKKVINIGYWLRKLNSIYQLPVNSIYEKWRLIPYSTSRPKQAIDQLTQKERELFDLEHNEYSRYTKDIDRVSNYEYDELLCKNIVFLDLYDSSANNAIIECMARATPVLVNPIPAVVEYLGEDYPFYFNTLEEAAGKVYDFDTVKSTHEYLKAWHIREKLSGQYFRKSFEDSEVYQLL